MYEAPLTLRAHLDMRHYGTLQRKELASNLQVTARAAPASVRPYDGSYIARHGYEVNMPDNATPQSEAQELDLRDIRRERRRPVVFAAYDDLAVGEALILVNDHEPKGLKEEFDRELAGSFDWDRLPAVDQEYRVRITKRASTALPRVVADTPALLQGVGPEDGGSIWQLQPTARDLDSNIIALPANDEIGLHIGPDLDVLILILQGTGELQTELNVLELQQGALVWLPRNAQRRFIAGPQGIQYLTVHQRKPTLNITAAPGARHL